MNANVQVDLTELASLSESLGTKGEELGKLLSNIKTQNSNLANYWQGPDAKNYFTDIEVLQNDMDNLVKAISSCSISLANIKSAYDEVISANGGAQS